MSHSRASKSANRRSAKGSNHCVSSHYKGARAASTTASTTVAVRTSRMDAPPKTYPQKNYPQKNYPQKPHSPKNHSQKTAALHSSKPSSKRKNRTSKKGAPLIVKRYVRWLFGKGSATKNEPAKRAFLATGSVATLALLAVVPAKVASQSMDLTACQEVVKSGAEISRGNLTRLVSIPSGATQASVHELIDVPYCLLPVSPDQPVPEKSDLADEAATVTDGPMIAREAYPLAFDPEAWVVVNYTASGYAGYDFAFKP